MGKSVVVDTDEMKRILSANSAIASSVIALSNLASRLPDGEEADALRSDLDKVLGSARAIQDTVDVVIKANK
jgi:hypothetical protein